MGRKRTLASDPFALPQLPARQVGEVARSCRRSDDEANHDDGAVPVRLTLRSPKNPFAKD